MKSIIVKVAIVKIHTGYFRGSGEEVTISTGEGAINGHPEPVLKSKT